MPTRNINLTEHFDRFVEEQIGNGAYKNASEVLRAALRLLEQQIHSDEEKLVLLRKLAATGFRSLDQGRGIAVVDEAGLRDAIAQMGQRASNPGKAQRNQ